MQVIAIANHKGGVGKTATTFTLGAVLADRGRRVLLVDIDPQSSLTGSAGIENQDGRSLAEVLGTGAEPGKVPLTEVIQPLADRLDIAPSSLTLAVTELSLVTRMGRENALKKALHLVSEKYDVVLIDCPPSLGLLTVNALTAAHATLIPTQPQAVDLRGLKLFLDTLERIREELNANLETLGILPTFFDRRLTHHNEAIKAMREANLPILSTHIGRSVRVAEAAATGQSVVTYDAKNIQSEAYRSLGAEVEQWLARNQH